MNNGRVFLSCCSSLTWILIRNSGRAITQSPFPMFFSQRSSATLTERRTCVAQIIHARGFVNLVQSNKHQHFNVLSRSSLHSVSDAGQASNRATWRPQLRLQMFALPFHFECDLRLEIGCLTTRRRFQRHSASGTVSKYRGVYLAEKLVTRKFFFGCGVMGDLFNGNGFVPPLC